MTISVQGPDGATAEFPDGTSPTAIRDAMRRHYGGPAQPTATPKPAPKPAGGGGWDKVLANLTDPLTEAWKQTSEADRQTREDFAKSYLRPRRPFDFQHDPTIGPFGIPTSVAMDAMNEASAPIAGAMTSIFGRPVEQFTGIPKRVTGNVVAAALPFGGEVRAGAEAGALAREAGISRSAARGLMETQAARAPLLRATQAPPKAPRQSAAVSRNATSHTGVILEPGRAGERVHDTQGRLDDGLNRLRKGATADQIEARHFLTATPKEIADPAVQAELYTGIEQRMVNPKARLSPRAAAAERHLAGWKAEEHALATELRKRGVNADDVSDLPSGKEGYVHRIRQGKGSYLDPADTGGAQGADPIMGRGRGLTRSAASLRPRQYWVMEDAKGERAWVGRKPKGEDWTAGEKVTASDGSERTARHATTAEIEANEPGAAYHKNALVNTVDNVLRLRRVKRNLDFLEDMKADLKERGLAHQEEWHYQDSDGRWVRARSNEETPAGFVETAIPQLKGWKFDPRIANTLNDFYGHDPSDLDSFLSKANRFLVGTMFFNPTVHIENVATHWAVGRGFDWFTPQGWGSLLADGARAMRAVATQNADYTRMLREGSGLIYGDVANQNFYKLMIEKAGHDIESDPQTWGGIARDLGWKTPAHLVKALYRASNKALWAVNDMFLLQRQFELERRGMPARKAIFQAERDIPNYRVPTQVLGQRWLREALTNPNISAFGRYNYGRFRALATMIKDVVKGGEPGVRKDAIGKLLVLGLMAFGIAPYANKALQKITGNPDAKLRGAGPFGPIDAAIEKATGDRDWGAFVASIITPAPLLPLAGEADANRDHFGRPVVEEQSTPAGKAVQLGEAAAGSTYPGQLAEQAAKPGGLAQSAAQNVGVKLPPPGSKERQRAYRGLDRKRALKREARDPIQQAILGALR